jgi:hypothetical protein
MARSRRLIWLVVALFAIALFAAGCGRRPVAPEVDMTPAAGSVDAPADDAATGTEDASTEEAAGEEGATDEAATDEGATDENAAPEEPGPAFAVGDEAIVVAIEGASLRSDAGEDAPVMQLYPMGDLVTILRPSGDYEAYPVEVDGVEWVRVRAADGLVGWVVVDAIEAAE